MGTIKATNIEPIADNGTVTLGSSGDTITAPTGVTVGGTMSNTPAFRATMSADQTVSDSTWTKINFDTIDYDTNSAYSTTNNRFTVPTGYAGKYLFTAGTNFYLDDTRRLSINLYVNGSFRNFNRFDVESASANSFTCITSSFVGEFSAGDYIEAYTLQLNGNNRGLNKNYVEFTGFKLIGT